MFGVFVFGVKYLLSRYLGTWYSKQPCFNRSLSRGSFTGSMLASVAGLHSSWLAAGGMLPGGVGWIWGTTQRVDMIGRLVNSMYLDFTCCQEKGAPQ